MKHRKGNPRSPMLPSLAIAFGLLGYSTNSTASQGAIQFGPLPKPNDFNAGIPVQDYAYQPNSNETYFQTWNLYFKSDSGFHVFANFAITNMGLGSNACGLNISITSPTGESKIDTNQVSGRNFRGQPQVFNMHCAHTFLKGNEEHLEIKGEHSELGIHLKVKREGPGLALPPFYLNGDRDDYVQFNLPYILASATGTITWKGKIINVKGRAMVAHINQSVGLHEYSLRWNRIRLLTHDTALLIGGFTPTHDFKEGYNIFVLAKGDKILHVSNAVQIKPLQYQTHENSSYEVPTKFSVKIDDDRINLHGTITKTREMASFDVLGHLNWLLRAIAHTFFSDPWIIRNDANIQFNYQLNDLSPYLTRKQLSAKGINEIIFINKD